MKFQSTPLVRCRTSAGPTSPCLTVPGRSETVSTATVEVSGETQIRPENSQMYYIYSRIVVLYNLELIGLALVYYKCNEPILELIVCHNSHMLLQVLRRDISRICSGFSVLYSYSGSLFFFCVQRLISIHSNFDNSSSYPFTPSWCLSSTTH